MKKLLLLNDTRMAGHHGSSAVVDVIFKEFEKRGIAVESHLERPTEPAAVRAHGYDAVIVNGEGSMHGGQRSSHVLSVFAKEASGHGVPVFLINTVFNEHDADVVERTRCFTSIHCRESRSVELLARYGIAARLCPDLTYGFDLDEKLSWMPGEKMVVLDTTLANKNKKLHGFCRHNGIAFLPIRTSPALLRATSTRNLTRIVKFNAKKYVGKLFPRTYRLNHYSNSVRGLNQFVRRIADGTRVIVAGRFHGVCFCMKVGVPFVAISSNTPKIEGMLEDAGLSGRMIDIERLSVDTVERKSTWSAEEERKRIAYVSAARAHIGSMFDSIAQRVA